MLPPLIERGRAGRGGRRSKNSVQERREVDRAVSAEIKTDRRGEQNQ